MRLSWRRIMRRSAIFLSWMPLAQRIARKLLRGVAHAAPVACAGPLLHAELTALERALNEAERPMLAVVGGSKVSTKLQVLKPSPIAATVLWWAAVLPTPFWPRGLSGGSVVVRVGSDRYRTRVNG